jgi:hypothetical protein
MGVPVLVTGDFVLDSHVYEGKRHQFGDRRNRGVHVIQELGGAALIHYLLDKLGGDVESHLGVKMKEDGRTPALGAGQEIPSNLKSYALWRGFGDGGNKSPARFTWLTQDALGFGELSEEGPFEWPVERLKAAPQVVVLSEGGMGFRDSKGRWPGNGHLDGARWILLKATDPFMEGALWTHLGKWAEKLVVIVSASELRRSRARVSKGLSWDSTVESVLTELTPGGNLEGLTCCSHLIVVFGTEGALWLELGKETEKGRVHLVYDADAIEGEHRKPEKGTAFGALSCMTAAAAWFLARGGSEPDLETALEGGLSAMCDLLEKGHGPATAPGSGYPAQRLAAVIKDATCRFARTVMPFERGVVKMVCPIQPSPAGADNCWSLIHEARRQRHQPCPDPAWDLAELVATLGPIALGSLPHISIGKLMSADRREIEALRVLQRLIIDYRDRDPRQCKKPLSIGVFGPPGAGKSFAVRQITEALLDKAGWLEFNLAQFKEGTDDLIGAFHQIRDRALTGKTPVAFFDEFDSRRYEWLQYLLAPMQDGAFQVGQITHPIGKCIFIFAGGTSRTFESFGEFEKDSPDDVRFRMSKGPDFKSRLDGFLDLLGPNQNEIAVDDAEGKAGGKRRRLVPDPCDIFHPVRRAFIIRGELGCAQSDKLNMDDAVLRALLRVDSYVHGARSMSKVLDPLKQAYPGRIYRSHLPPLQQLGLHVAARDFMNKCCYDAPAAPPQLSQQALDTMAEAIHAVWEQLGVEQGWRDPAKVTRFADLSDFFKRSNLAAARRMPEVLGLVGLALQPGENTPEQREGVRLQIEQYLELVAEAEHAGWMEWHLDQGWMYGPKKDEAKLTEEPKRKTHPCLKPYIELDDVDRNKDRNSIRHYLDFAKKAGMKIVEANNVPAKKKQDRSPLPARSTKSAKRKKRTKQ